MKVNPKDFATIAICAIRYCHGRQTYMPSLVQGIIRPHLQEFEDMDLSVMLQDCDGMRDFDFGDPMIDRPHWKKWHEDLKKEKDRRDERDRKRYEDAVRVRVLRILPVLSRKRERLVQCDKQATETELGKS